MPPTCWADNAPSREVLCVIYFDNCVSCGTGVIVLPGREPSHANETLPDHIIASWAVFVSPQPCLIRCLHGSPGGSLRDNGRR
jgi:hypothetical protein